MKGYGAQGHFLYLIQSFYQPRVMKVVLNSQISRSFCINASIPQDSILGLSLFFFSSNTSVLLSFSDSLSMLMTQLFSRLDINSHRLYKIQFEADLERFPAASCVLRLTPLKQKGFPEELLMLSSRKATYLFPDFH